MSDIQHETSLCLVAIVKDEAAIIKRCIDSVRPLITAWCIIDTGSTDGTQDVIKDCLKDLPGQLHERPWVNFEHNKTEAIQLATGLAEYDLFIDADDVIEVAPSYKLPKLTHSQYDVPVYHSTIIHPRPHIFKNDYGYKFVSVVHEYLHTDNVITIGQLSDIKYKCVGGGVRGRDPEKYKKDAVILQDALTKDPNNARYVFYCAQSWRDYGDNKKALKYYLKRVPMVGFFQESFISLFEIAKIYERTNAPTKLVIDAYVQAAEYFPDRLTEPMYYLAKYLRLKDKFALAYIYAKSGIHKEPSIGLFVEHGAYTWGIYDELAVAAFYIGRFDECIKICQFLLINELVPENDIARVQNNLNESVKILDRINVAKETTQQVA